VGRRCGNNSANFKVRYIPRFKEEDLENFPVLHLQRLVLRVADSDWVEGGRTTLLNSGNETDIFNVASITDCGFTFRYWQECITFLRGTVSLFLYLSIVNIPFHPYCSIGYHAQNSQNSVTITALILLILSGFWRIHNYWKSGNRSNA
jgi:hypothetical protein